MVGRRLTGIMAAWCVAAGLLVSSQPVVAAEAVVWSQFRGPGGLGISNEKGLPTTWSAEENVVWKTPLPGAGTSSPIVLGDRIFLTCYSGYNMPGSGRGERGSQENLKLHVMRLDLNGKIVWTKDVAPKLPEQERIRDDHGYASATPAADGERLFVFFGKSGVFAFDHDGKQLWQADVGSELSGWGSAASVVLHKNRVIVNASVESESLVGLDRDTGKEVWRVKRIREAWNTPILVTPAGGKPELVVAMPKKLLAVDPETGEEVWHCNSPISSYIAPSMIAHDGVVYCVGGRTNGCLAVRAGGKGDVTESHIVWEGIKGSNVTSPVYHNGHIYWCSDIREIAYCAEAATGKIVYEERVSRLGGVYGSPVLADGKIYYPARSGRVYVVPAEPKFSILQTNSLGDRGDHISSPAIAAGRIYLRNNKFLYALGTK